jgi:O-phosphoseryl-tRNA(Cys) synthetase
LVNEDCDPKRNHYMVIKWSKKDTHEKWGGGKKNLKTRHKRNKSPRRGYIIVNWGKQWHTRMMWMSRKPQNISVRVGFIRLFPHLTVPSYHHTSVTFPTGDLPYFPVHKTHRDFFVRNFRKK